MRIVVLFLSSALFGLGLVSCDSSSSGARGGGSANFTYNGQSVPTADATALVGPVNQTSGGTANVVLVMISNQQDTCGIVQRNGNPPNAKMLSLTVGSSSTPTTGTYNIGSGAAGRSRLARSARRWCKEAST